LSGSHISSLRLCRRSLTHKTDAGVVCLNLNNPASLEQAYRCVLENVKRAGSEDLEGILVQRMAERGLELFIGAKQDPCFGPLTMVGKAVAS
jgi:acyl-CoA synthetase (NDP forming)